MYNIPDLENFSFDLNSNDSHYSSNLLKPFSDEDENSYDLDHDSRFFHKDVKNKNIRNDEVEKDEKIKKPEDYSNNKTGNKILFKVEFVESGKIGNGKKLKINQKKQKNSTVTAPSSENSELQKNNNCEKSKNEIKKEADNIIIPINDNIKQSNENNIETKKESNGNHNLVNGKNFNDNINKKESEYNDEKYLNKKRKKLKLIYGEKKDSFYKRVRRIVLNTLRRFINKKLKSSYKTKYKSFKSLYFAVLSRANADEEKKFLNQKLINIFSGVSDKHAKYNKDENKKLIQELIEKDSEYNFKEFFELSFLDCLNHLNTKHTLNLLIGIEKSEEEILNEEKLDEDEIGEYKKFLKNYEKDINDRKPRNPKKNINN